MIVFAEHDDQRPFALFQRHGNGPALEPQAQFRHPEFDRLRRIIQRAALGPAGRSAEAPVMFFIRPVDPHQGGEFRFCVGYCLCLRCFCLLHRISPYIGTCVGRQGLVSPKSL